MFECTNLYYKEFLINNSKYAIRIYKMDYIKKPFICLVCRFGNSLILNNLNAILYFIKDSEFDDKYIIEQAIFEYMS